MTELGAWLVEQEGLGSHGPKFATDLLTKAKKVWELSANAPPELETEVVEYAVALQKVAEVEGDMTGEVINVLARYVASEKAKVARERAKTEQD